MSGSESCFSILALLEGFFEVVEGGVEVVNSVVDDFWNRAEKSVGEERRREEVVSFVSLADVAVDADLLQKGALCLENAWLTRETEEGELESGSGSRGAKHLDGELVDDIFERLDGVVEGEASEHRLKRWVGDESEYTDKSVERDAGGDDGDGVGFGPLFEFDLVKGFEGGEGELILPLADNPVVAGGRVLTRKGVTPLGGFVGDESWEELPGAQVVHH